MQSTKTSGGSTLWRNIFSGGVVRAGSTEEILSKVPAFANLSPRELKEVAVIMHRREYRAGEPIFYQGDPGLGMYIIQEGEVSIQMAGKDGEKSELVVLSDGDFFGELALLDESPRSADAVSKTDCLLLGFFRPDLFELIEQKNGLGIKIVLKLAEIVAQRLRTTDKELSKIRSQLDRLQEQLERKSHGTSEGSTAEAAAAS